MHLLNDYKVGNSNSHLDVELRAAKEEQKKLEKKILDMENQSSELADANKGFLTQVWMIFFLLLLLFYVC